MEPSSILRLVSGVSAATPQPTSWCWIALSMRSLLRPAIFSCCRAYRRLRTPAHCTHSPRAAPAGDWVTRDRVTAAGDDDGRVNPPSGTSRVGGCGRHSLRRAASLPCLPQRWRGAVDSSAAVEAVVPARLLLRRRVARACARACWRRCCCSTPRTPALRTRFLPAARTLPGLGPFCTGGQATSSQRCSAGALLPALCCYPQCSV